MADYANTIIAKLADGALPLGLTSADLETIQRWADDRFVSLGRIERALIKLLLEAVGNPAMLLPGREKTAREYPRELNEDNDLAFALLRTGATDESRAVAVRNFREKVTAGVLANIADRLHVRLEITPRAGATLPLPGMGLQSSIAEFGVFLPHAPEKRGEHA